MFEIFPKDHLQLCNPPDDVLCPEDNVADFRLYFREDVHDFPPNHYLHQMVLIQALRISATDIPTVTVSRNAVADGEDLARAVEDVDDRNALLYQAADMSKQNLHFTITDAALLSVPSLFYPFVPLCRFLKQYAIFSSSMVLKRNPDMIIYAPR